MRELEFTRRGALAALTAAAAAAVAKPAVSAEGLRFREIRVDVSPMRENYQSEEAGWVAAVLPGYLRQTFAKYLAPGDRSAAILVARIDLVTLGSPGEGGGGLVFADSTRDGIDGAGLVLDGSGRTIRSYPLYSSVYARTFEHLPNRTEIERERVETVALSFAQWLPGQMGL